MDKKFIGLLIFIAVVSAVLVYLHKKNAVTNLEPATITDKTDVPQTTLAQMYASGNAVWMPGNVLEIPDPDPFQNDSAGGSASSSEFYNIITRGA